MHKYYKAFFIFMIIASLLALIIAYLLEIYGGLEPCRLCIYQRFAYVAAIFFCAAGYFSVKLKKIAGLLVVLTFGMGSYLALMHTGVEYGWFTVDIACTKNFLMDPDATIDDFRQVIQGQVLAPCNRSEFSFIWITLAGWNFIYSTVLFFFSFITITTFLLRANYKYYDRI